MFSGMGTQKGSAGSAAYCFAEFEARCIEQTKQLRPALAGLPARVRCGCASVVGTVRGIVDAEIRREGTACLAIARPSSCLQGPCYRPPCCIHRRSFQHRCAFPLPPSVTLAQPALRRGHHSELPCAFSADVFGTALRGNACHDFCIFGSRSGTVSGATFRHQKLVSLSVHMAAPYWGELHRHRKVGSFFVSENGLGFGVGKRHRGNRNPGWLCGPPVSNFLPLPTHLSAAAAHRHRRRSAPRFCKVGAS